MKKLGQVKSLATFTFIVLFGQAAMGETQFLSECYRHAAAGAIANKLEIPFIAALGYLERDEELTSILVLLAHTHVTALKQGEYLAVKESVREMSKDMGLDGIETYMMECVSEASKE